MDKKFAFQIPSQTPEYINDSGPLMSEFLRLYYAYTEQRKKAVGLTQYHSANMDLDNSLSEYIDKFYSIRASKFPIKPKLGKSQLIKLLNEIYDAKGTEKSYKLLFRVLFGEEISISHPGDLVLRASDGRWAQPSFITVIRTNESGEPVHPQTQFTLNVETGSGNQFNILVRSIELIDDNSSSKTYRYFFDKGTITPFEKTNWLYSNLDNYQYTVSLQKVYTKLHIVTPGTNWRVGQVFQIPHDTAIVGTNVSLHRNTVARVKSITSTGGILSAEIIEHGWPHSVNHSALVSPYPESSKPPGSVTDIYTNLVELSNGSLVYEHNVNLFDQLNTSEYVTGLFYQEPGGVNSYFMEDYIESSGGYMGDRVFAIASSPSTIITNDQSLSLEDWLSSRASVTLLPEYVSTSRGVYSGDNGKLSNQNVRLEDNYFYQLFSYVIETEVDINEYREAINELHPAGLKRFSKLNKVARAKLNYTVDRVLSNDRIDLLDIVDLDNDSVSNDITKQLSDNVSASDVITNRTIKYITDSLSVSDGNSSNVDLGVYFETDYMADTYTVNEIAITIA